jgi:hypothetical protein
LNYFFEVPHFFRIRRFRFVDTKAGISDGFFRRTTRFLAAEAPNGGIPPSMVKSRFP